MKRILIYTAIGATVSFGISMAGGDAHAAYPLPPTTTVAEEVAAPVPTPTTAAPILTVPPVVDSPLPSTGTDSMSTITIASVAGATGLGLIVVARSRRRRPATQS